MIKTLQKFDEVKNLHESGYAIKFMQFLNGSWVELITVAIVSQPNKKVTSDDIVGLFEYWNEKMTQHKKLYLGNEEESICFYPKQGPVKLKLITLTNN